MGCTLGSSSRTKMWSLYCGVWDCGEMQKPTFCYGVESALRVRLHWMEEWPGGGKGPWRKVARQVWGEGVAGSTPSGLLLICLGWGRATRFWGWGKWASKEPAKPDWNGCHICCWAKVLVEVEDPGAGLSLPIGLKWLWDLPEDARSPGTGGAGWGQWRAFSVSLQTSTLLG